MPDAHLLLNVFSDFIHKFNVLNNCHKNKFDMTYQEYLKDAITVLRL